MNSTELEKLSNLYKIFGDPTRLRILCSLFEREMCVCDIADNLEITVSCVSHQLKTLKNASLIKSRRMGKSIIYSLADDHVKTILNQGLEHINE